MIYSQSLLALALLNVASAHICMWAPMQRGGANVATPGESACYLKEGPCGGVASAEPTTTLEGGKDFTISFQQNLNHFYIDNPGKLVVDFAVEADPTEDQFTLDLGFISDYNAMNEITQTNFTHTVRIPNVDVDHGVLRLRYLSQNPTENDRGMTFYQCADVKVVKSEEVIPTAPVAPQVPASKVNVTEIECCAPQQFTMTGHEMASWRNPTSKKYYFDAVHKLFRVDTVSGSGSTTQDGSFQMISNFTSGIEYYYNVRANTCDLYGLNYWSDWCYGSINVQSYASSVTVGTQVADVWSQANSPFIWTNTRESCIPVSQIRSDTGEATFYFDLVEGEPDQSVFTIPAACKRAEEALTDAQRKALKPSARRAGSV